MSFWNKLGFKSFGPKLDGVSGSERIKYVGKHLHGEKAADAKKANEEAKRILNIPGYSAAVKLRMQETNNLKYKDGTAWLNLVLTFLEQDKSILAEVLDLPGEVRRVLAQEKAKRSEMPEAKQLLLDTIVHTIEQRNIFNAPVSRPADDAINQAPDKTA